MIRNEKFSSHADFFLDRKISKRISRPSSQRGNISGRSDILITLLRSQNTINLKKVEKKRKPLIILFLFLNRYHITKFY